MRRERGFLQMAGLLAAPGLKVAFWVGIALVIVLEALAIRALYRKWQAEVEDHARTRGEYSAFVEAVRLRGEEAQKETARIETGYREALRHAKETHAADVARRDADLRRLRERPPTDPGGRAVPVVAVDTGGTDAAAKEFVPLDDYRALEERAYDDARTLSALQAYLRTLGVKVE